MDSQFQYMCNCMNLCNSSNSARSKTKIGKTRLVGLAMKLKAATLHFLMYLLFSRLYLINELLTKGCLGDESLPGCVVHVVPHTSTSAALCTLSIVSPTTWHPLTYFLFSKIQIIKQKLKCKLNVGLFTYTGIEAVAEIQPIEVLKLF